MASPAEKKFRERLKKFLTEKNPPKKWKSLTKIIDKETPENVTQLFLKHQDDIIFALTKFQQSLEQLKDNEKTKKQQELDALEVHRVLKLVLERLSNLIKTRFKYAEISQCISRSLAKQNKHSVRKAALESLMVFIEVLIQQPGREVDEMLSLFAGSVILQVFVPDVKSATGSQIKIRNQPTSVEEGGAVCPSGAEPTVEEQKDLFASVLDFVASRVGKGNLFEFWFETVHRAYLVYLYPEIFKQLGSLPPGESDMGFGPICPHPIQQVLIEKIDSWKDNATICEMLFSDRFYPFSLEIFNQSCRLPITYLAIIKKSLEVFKYFLVLKRRSNIVRDHLVQLFWRAFIQSMALVFTIDSTPAQSEGHAQLFQEVFSCIDMFTLQLAGSLEEPTWKTLQYTLLDGTASFLAKNQMSMLSDSKTDIVRMADPLISYLFTVWIRSPVTSPDMWRDMHVAFCQTTDWPHAIRQWKIKVLSLTEILIKFFHVRHAEYMMPTDLSFEDSVSMFLGVPYWTKESISKMWYTVLNVSGNINHIKSAYNFEVAMKCVQDVVALLLQAEAAIPLREEPRRMPPIDVFMPWLMEACYATGEKIRGVIIAYAVLCQLFCTQHVKQIAPELLSHFFRAIQVGLRSENPLVRDQIMSEAKYLFSYDLPGSAVLIPEMINEITSVFKVRQGATAEVQKNAVAMTNSLICYPHHFKGVMVPDVSKSREINSVELRESLATLHMTIMNTQNIAPAAKVMNIWGTVVLIFEEINNEQPRTNLLAACIQSATSLTRHQNEIVAQAACEALQTLSAIFPQLTAFDRNLSYSALSLTIDSLLALFQEGSQTGAYREPLMILLFEALNMWITREANDFLRDKNLATKCFTAIELGVLGQSVDPLKPSMTLSRVKTEEDLTTAPYYYLIEQLDMKPTHNLAGVKAAAEMLLHSVLDWHNNFPSPIGAAQLDANVVEDADKPMWAFSQNNEKIITFQDTVDSTGHPVVRAITRDASGKHVWIFRHNILPDQRFPIRTPFLGPPPSIVDLEDQGSSEAPRTKSPLLDMLQYFNKNNMDILPKSPKFVQFDSPILPDQSYASEIEGAKLLIDKVQQVDSETVSKYKENRPVLDRDMFSLGQPLSNLAHARWLLSHFGFLGPHTRRVFHSLDDTADLRMAFRALDRTRSRECLDIGVLYIAAGQENMDEYIQNRNTSVAFSHLVDGLGWKVDARVTTGHRGEFGPEDCPVFPYYSDARTEMVFHVSSMLTGNATPIADVLDSEYVQVVWNEHKRDFIMPPKPVVPGQGRDPITDSYLVVHPLLNGLFRVQVQKRDNLTPFGPLMTGMVVTKRLLPSLLRMTALISHRRSTKARKFDWKHPMTERALLIRDLATVQKKLRPPELFLSHLFPVEFDPMMAYPAINRPGVQIEATRRRGDSLIARTTQPPGVALPGGVNSRPSVSQPVAQPAAISPDLYRADYGKIDVSAQAQMMMKTSVMELSQPAAASDDIERFSYRASSELSSSPTAGFTASSSPSLSSSGMMTFSLNSSNDTTENPSTTFMTSSGEVPPSPLSAASASPAATPKTPVMGRPSVSTITCNTQSPATAAPTSGMHLPPGAKKVGPATGAIPVPTGGPRPSLQATQAVPVTQAPQVTQPAPLKFPLSRPSVVGLPAPATSPPQQSPINLPTASHVVGSPAVSKLPPTMPNGRPLPVGATPTPGMAMPPKVGVASGPVGINRTTSNVGPASPRVAPPSAPGAAGSPQTSAPGSGQPAQSPIGLNRAPSGGLGRPAPPGAPAPGVPAPAPGPSKALPPTPGPAPSNPGAIPPPGMKAPVKIAFGVKMPGVVGMMKQPPTGPPKTPGMPPSPM